MKTIWLKIPISTKQKENAKKKMFVFENRLTSHIYVQIYQNNLATNRTNHGTFTANQTIKVPKIKDKLAYK